MKWSSLLLTLLLIASSIPVAQAQGDASGEAAVTDPEGDVHYIIAEQQTLPASDDHGPADITSFRLEETRNELLFTVTVANLDQWPEGSGFWMDAASLDMRFWVGDMFYNVRTGIGQSGFAYGEIRGGQTDMREPTIQGNLETIQQGSSFTVVVPRDLIRDESGAPVQQGMALSDFHVDSHVHLTGFFIPDPQTGELIQVFGIRDRMPDDGGVSVPVMQGGPESSGPVSLSSPAPYRASNGGEGTFKFDLQAIQVGEEERVYDLLFEDVPPSWTVERPEGLLRLPPGIPAEFSVLVTTPFGHQHGGAETLTFRIADMADPNQWASIELGLYYVAVPQPSGHHPTMWFHSTESPAFLGTGLQTALGGASGEMFMNTIDQDEDDQGVPVQGWTGIPTNDRFNWAICMQPELLMGLDMDVDGLGTIELPFQSSRGYDDVSVYGRLLHLGPGDDINSCFSPQYSDRHQTELATFEAAEPVDIGSSTTVLTLDVLPTEASDYIPFESGSMLVVELVADPADPLPFQPIGGTGGGSVSGPESLDLMPGGFITLPLNEYHDARPGGLIGLNAGDEEQADNTTLDSVEFIPPAETMETPALPVLSTIVAIAALAVIRRRF